MVMINYFFMCLIFGTTFLAIKIGVDAGVPPFLSAGLRFFIAGLLLFSFMVWREKRQSGYYFGKRCFYRSGLNLWDVCHVILGRTVCDIWNRSYLICYRSDDDHRYSDIPFEAKRKSEIIHWLCRRSYWCHVLALT